MHQADPRHAARLVAYVTASTRLSLLSDRRLGEAVAAADPIGFGIGGRSAELDIDGTRVFVKRIPLTDVEMRSENVVFLEYLPRTLSAWLSGHRDAVPPSGDSSPYPWVEEALARGAAFMSPHGLVHFDAHFRNILTDGQLLYFADFGLALSSDFELSEAEAEFLSNHLAYDRYYTASHLLRYHLPGGTRGEMAHDAFLQQWIAGRQPDHVPPEIAAIIDRHAKAAVILDNFHHRLLTGSKRTPFPAAEMERAHAGASAPR